MIRFVILSHFLYIGDNAEKVAKIDHDWEKF